MHKKGAAYILILLFLVSIVNAFTLQTSPVEPMKGGTVSITISASKYSRYSRVCDSRNRCRYPRINCNGYWCSGTNTFDLNIPTDFKAGPVSVRIRERVGYYYTYSTKSFNIKELDQKAKLTCSRTKIHYLTPHYGNCNPTKCTANGWQYYYCRTYPNYWWYRWWGLAGKKMEICKEILTETTACTKDPTCSWAYKPVSSELCLVTRDTDYGDNPFTQGTTSGITINDQGYEQQVTHEDVCINDTTLLEAHIGENDCMLHYREITCGQGCLNGACKGLYLTDPGNVRESGVIEVCND